MKTTASDMQALFNSLSEKNKDILILVAKSVKVAQDSTIPSKSSINSHSA